jgi:hypothetical protein
VGFFMIVLRREGDRGLIGADAHGECRAARADRELPIAQAPDEVEGRAHRLLARQAQRVLGDGRLDRRAHRGGRAEEPIGGRCPLEPLVRALEVVVLHEERDASLTVLEVGEHRARKELLPHRLPEPLDLPAGLRVVRAALHMRNPVALQFRFELRRAAPRGVLPPLIGQDLPRRAAVRNAARQGLEHERAALVMGHREAHQVSRVIVEECRDVDALVLAQQEREEIRLPELIGLGALEATHLEPRLRLRGCSRTLTVLGVQHPPHRRLGGTDPQEPLHHITDPPASRLRVRGLRCEDRCATGRRSARRLLHGRVLPRLERRRTARSIAPHPVDRRRVRHAEPLRYFTRAQPLLDHGACELQAHVRRPILSPRSPRRVRLARTLRLALAYHLSAPLPPLRQLDRRTSARYLRHHPRAHKVVRGTNIDRAC